MTNGAQNGLLLIYNMLCRGGEKQNRGDFIFHARGIYVVTTTSSLDIVDCMRTHN